MEGFDMGMGRRFGSVGLVCGLTGALLACGTGGEDVLGPGRSDAGPLVSDGGSGSGTADGGSGSGTADGGSGSGTADGGPGSQGDAQVSADAGPSAPVVDVASGRLSGVEVAGTAAFLGVPFAAPPVGTLRWREPAPVAPWDGTLAATTYGSPCVQVTGTFVSDDGEPGQAFGREDCLHLNVWTPRDRLGTNAERPVIFFIHGGGNVAGSTGDPLAAAIDIEDPEVPLYDGSRLAARGDVVVVTTNYRLGVLGFLALDALDEESATGTSGNYGLRDQIAALEWVQENIRAFGGDPRRVLLVGQSGGGRDVNLLNVSPRARGLFAGVAVHSAPLGAAELGPLKGRAEDLSVEMGCPGSSASQLECLRQVDPGALVTAEAARPLGLASAAFLPTVDGDVVTDQPRTILASGGGARVPMLLSNLALEYAHRWTELSEASYPAAVTSMVGAQAAPTVLARYPVDEFASAALAFSTLMSDRNVTCPYRSFGRTVAAAGVPVWMVRFAQLLPEPVRLGEGAYHTSELVYLFQHLDGDHFASSFGDRQTQAFMLHYWVAFAEALDPNEGGPRLDDPVDPPAWPRYAPNDERYLLLSEEAAVASHFGSPECDMWDSLIP